MVRSGDAAEVAVPCSSRRRRDDSGAAAVEFALVSVLLFMVLFGIMQYGYGYFQLQSAAAAAHEAARRASFGITDCSDWSSTVTSAARGNGLNAQILSATMNVAKADPTAPSYAVSGDTLTVELTYKPGLRLPFVPYPSRIRTSASTTFEGTGVSDSKRSCP